MVKPALLLFLLSVATIHFSCLKNTGVSNSTTAPEDAVTGNYLAVTVPPNYIAGSATISKTGGGKYQFTPGSAAIPTFAAAAIPSFSFQYEPIGSLFVNGFAYLIPKQTSNTILLDSAYLTLYTGGANTISFTLTSHATGASWIYSGVKQ